MPLAPSGALRRSPCESATPVVESNAVLPLLLERGADINVDAAKYRGSFYPAWTAAGRATIERFFAGFCAGELRGAPRVLHAPGFSFSDVARKVVSIVNLASVTAVESLVGKAVHPLRFRANLYVSGWPAWREFELVGRQIAIGKDAQLKIVKRIVRCAAIDVDPETAIRDLSIPHALMRSLGHADCGVYGEVVRGGEIAVGDELHD